MKAAAAIVIAVGLGVAYWSNQLPGAPTPEQAEVLISEDVGHMTDGRFVELTKEVLRADRRYHSALFQIMEQVIRDTRDIEASAEEAFLQPEDGEFLEAETAGRLPA